MDIKDEGLAANFEKFHNEMHTIDTMILEAMKANFDDVTHISEQCEILDIFFSMSERSRVKAAYHQRADTVTSMLSEELARLNHESSTSLSYTLRLYSPFAVDLIRSHGLVQRSNSLVEDVTISNIFLSDSNKIKNINEYKMPIQENFEKRIKEAKKERGYLDVMEVAFKSFIICRGAGFEGSLDIVINRDLPTASFNTKMLESLGENIVSGRASLFERHDAHKLNVAYVCRVVCEYNITFSQLSLSERGLFR